MKKMLKHILVLSMFFVLPTTIFADYFPLPGDILIDGDSPTENIEHTDNSHEYELVGKYYVNQVYQQMVNICDEPLEGNPNIKFACVLVSGNPTVELTPEDGLDPRLITLQNVVSTFTARLTLPNVAVKPLALTMGI